MSAVRTNPAFAPYKVAPSGICLEELLGRINAQCYMAHGPDYRYGPQRIIANPLHAYRRFLGAVAGDGRFEFVTFRRLYSAPRPADKVQVLIRHDVDIDVVTAWRQAQIEHELGVVSTYFFLHNAPYHGRFDGKAFYRHECIRHLYKEFEDLGHEVGLHNDALDLYMNRRIDGSQALVAELEWMRGAGLDVIGTVAHNHLPTYGAENYEIFAGRAVVEWEGEQAGDYKNEREVCSKGRVAPLRVLDERELGLIYEGNDAFKYGEGPVEYGATRFLDLWRWNMHIRRYREDPDPPNTYFVGEDVVLRDILSLSPGTLLILTVHPVYYGCRHAMDKGPPPRRDRLCLRAGGQTGWRTYQPETVQCRLHDDGADERQAVNFANELGMLDRAWSKAPGAELRILLLGGDNLDAPHLGIDGHCHARLEAILRDASGKEVAVRKLAFSGMGLSRLWTWYETMGRKLHPQVVVLGIGALAPVWNFPRAWSVDSGFSASHPPASGSQ